MTQRHEKMLNITHHQGNANQKHSGMSPPTSSNDLILNFCTFVIFYKRKFNLINLWSSSTSNEYI